MGHPEGSKQLVKWFHKSSGGLFKFPNLFRRLVSVLILSVCTAYFCKQWAHDSYLVFDVKPGVIVGCDD